MTHPPVTHGLRRARVVEFSDVVGLTVGPNFDERGMALPAAEAVKLAGQLLDAAAHVLDRQFQKAVGNP